MSLLGTINDVATKLLNGNRDLLERAKLVKTDSEDNAEGRSSVLTATRTYTVRSGDTLSGIAKDFYGKASLYPEIFHANRDVLTDPDLIKPGQTLRIPELD